MHNITEMAITSVECIYNSEVMMLSMVATRVAVKINSEKMQCIHERRNTEHYCVLHGVL